MLNIFFIRHGESRANAEKIISDIATDLTVEGKRQAKQVAQFFKGKSVDALYSSHMIRACQTAKELEFVLNKKAIIAPEWAERTMGKYAGLTEAQLHEKYPNIKQEWEIQGFDWKPDTGESINDVFIRSMNSFNNLIKKHNFGETIIVVSHGSVLRALRMTISKEDKSTFLSAPHLKNCEIMHVQWDGKSAKVV